MPRPGKVCPGRRGRSAENEARGRAEVLEKAMGAMRNGLIIYGPDRRVVAANDQVELSPKAAAE